ncbi:hypothetical protein LAZ67_2004452, partial [Cordylochernes scorpioides]
MAPDICQSPTPPASASNQRGSGTFVLSYDSRRSEVIEPNFVYVAALCDPEHVCSSCIKVRQGRGEDQESADGEDGSTAVLGSGAPLYVAVTVPLHEAGPGPLQCGPRLRPESVLALEATLWALRGLQVGAVVVDTCGSPLLAARRLLRHPQAVVAAISLGGPAETRAVAELMAPLNVTTVSAHRADRVLHVSPSQERISHAVLSTLRSAGWTHVALVHSSGEKDSANIFQQLAEKEGICVATQVEINEFNNTREALDEVLRTRKRGVTAVVLWCNEADTTQFFHDVHHAANEGLVRPGDFAWLSAGDWGYHLDTIRGSETEALGALVFRPQMDEDPELVDYMKTLNPAHGGTSWLTELWNQEVHCTSQDPKCTGSLPAWGPLIWGAARAAGAVATGVVRLRREVCPQEQGLCPRLLRQPHLRELLAGAVRRSEVFTPSGHGEVPVDVFNLQMVPGNGFAYQKFCCDGGCKVLCCDQVGYYDHQLHQVANAATYGPDGSRKPLASRRSSCSDCGSCGHVETARFPSPDGIILVGVFPVHHRGALPFQCGALRDVSSVEAFLWALDAVNSDNSLGVKLGGLAIDSCSNRDKAYRDATNILSGKDTVTGLLVHQTSTELNPLAELAAPLGLPVILPLSVDISPQVSTSLVPLAPSHQELSSLVSSVLLRLQWTHVSLLTSAARQDLAQHFSTVADQAGIHLALMETIPTGAYDMSALVARVEDKQRRGARLVSFNLTHTNFNPIHVLHRKKSVQCGILWTVHDFRESRVLTTCTPTSCVDGDCFSVRFDHSGVFRVVVSFLTSKDLDLYLEAMGSPRGTVLLHAALGDDLSPLLRHPEAALGALVLRPGSPNLPGLERHLRLGNATWINPWLHEACPNGPPCQLRTGPLPLATAQGVFAVARTLEELRRALCPPTGPVVCPQLREKLPGVLLPPLRAVTQYEVVVANYVRVGPGQTAFLPVGSFHAGQLALNVSVLRGYDPNTGRDIALESVRTFCLDCSPVRGPPDALQVNLPLMPSLMSPSMRQSPSRKVRLKYEITFSSPPMSWTSVAPMPMLDASVWLNATKCYVRSYCSLMQYSCVQVNPKSGFVLATFLSVHEASDSGFFRCGNFSSPAALQSLAAVILALSRGPRNGVQLGARIMDFCGRKQLALERLFTLYQNSDPKSIIASLSFDMSAARELGPVLQSLQVPQITVASPSEPFALAPPATDQLQPLALFLKAFSWDYVYVIHSNDDYGSKTTKEFLKVANANGICLADYFTLPNEATSEVIIESFLGHLVDSQARVIVVIADDALKARRILQAAKVAKVLSKYVWVLNEVWDNDKYILNTIKDAPLDIFSVKTQGLVNKEFKESFSKLNLDNPGSIPKEWLEEFWQHNFHCQLPSSRVVQKQYSDICSRTEKLDVESMVQNRLVFQTIKSVEAVGEGLNRFLKRHCSLTVKNIEECGANARTELAKEIKSALECQDCKNSAGGQQIFQWKMAKDFHSSYVLSEIGLWNSGQWTYLKNATSLNYVLGKLPASTCTTEECGKCTNLIATQEALMVAGRDGVLSRLKTAWGVTITSLSVLGIFFVLVCTLYFLMSFPVSVGTTILGYMILMGVMALYGVNFAFLLAPPSEALFALGLAYSVVFSGMVIKVFNTWRRQRKNCEGMSPMGLLLQAVLLASVQGGIIALWLTLGGGTRSDVQEFAVALTYPGFLACIAALLAGVTWWDRESRWMLACCGLTAAVWSSWGLAVWGLGHVARPAVAANLVCATGVMLCLYLRKVYLYSKLSRDREMKMRLQPSSPNPASLYGTLHDNLSPVLFGQSMTRYDNVSVTGSQATLNNNSTKKIFGSRSKVREDDARSDSSGSVQVQGTDLYPLDMYDGGSQFQPYRHRDTDTLPFARS